MMNNYSIIKEIVENDILYVLINTPYGICKQRKVQYLNNHIVSIQSALDKTQYYINQYVEKFKDHSYDLSYINYNHSKSKIIIKDKYGFCEIRADQFLSGGNTSLSNTINKTEYFINKAKEIHGNKYDYSKVIYINGKSKVKIISEYGEFLQTPNSHLAGDGCPKVAKNTLALTRGWSLTSWKTAANNSKNFAGYKLYLIKCWDEYETFYKIGITFVEIISRFKYTFHLPYKYEIIKIIESKDPKEIFNLENYYKKQYKEYKYIPRKVFGGMQECFNTHINIKDNE